MEDLKNILLDVDKDQSYQVIEVLKNSETGRVEKVIDHNGGLCIRKYSSKPTLAEKEYELLSSLHHPSLPKVVDYYEIGDESVLVEEYAEGIKLSDFIRASGRLSVEQSLETAIALCEVCRYLHSQKPLPVIHRDIKPDNIICTADGSIKLIDFGAAREYKSDSEKDTVYVGTMGYAPPEQFGFGQTDCRSDVYGIGMTLLHMLTGKAPERGQSVNMKDSGLPVQLQYMIEKAIQFDPVKRFADTTEFSIALKKFLVKPPAKPAFPIYPKHSRLPAVIKVLLLPFHFVLLLTFVAVMMNGLFSPTGFGWMDDLLLSVNHLFLFIFLLFPSYILGFNLFDLRQKIGFFHKNCFLKKVLIILLLFIVGAFLITGINSLHSEEFQRSYTVNSAAS